MKKAIWEELSATKTSLLQAIDAVSADKFNTIPFAGSWTAGQVSEHVLLVASGGVAILKGSGQTTTRLPDEQVAPLRDLFLNFTIKMTSPDFVKPSDSPQDKEAMLRSLEHAFEEMITLSQNEDLTLIFPDAEMPQFGLLTRLEWLSFIVYHTQRHIRQLQNIQTCFQ